MSTQPLGKFYVYAVGSGRITTPHDTRDAAEKEASRLVAKQPTKRFLVLHAVTELRMLAPVTITRVEDYQV